ncbi:hypothetical protein L6164_035741 [Bauhinia variegata]|uniref:Uncharacterized protein n=1 Tax=Bauhinia variegata TaxID=167791 RepID=A0ACB9KF15_BAUVA|nr:hypothetical protein L6164_035741 [Bauhinia variegata]
MENKEEKQSHNSCAADSLTQNHVPGINNGDPPPSQSHSNPIYFFNDQPFHQNSISQSHPFDNSVTQNRHAGNSMLQIRDFFPARNQNQYQSSGLTPAEPIAGLENVQDSLSRFHLSSPINPARSYDFGARLAMDSRSPHLSQEQQRRMGELNALPEAHQGFLNHDPFHSVSYAMPQHQFLGALPRNKFRTMQDVRGKVVLAAKDSDGYRLLLEKINEGNPVNIGLFFCEIKDHVHELMTDQHGTLVIQKLFEAGNVNQMNTIVSSVIQNEHNFIDACIESEGSRAVQTLLSNLRTPEQITVVVAALKRITITLFKHLNGWYVIQHCLKIFSPVITKYFLDVGIDNCVDISTDRGGCSVIQKCLGSIAGEPLGRLLREIITYALLLSQDPYGNYVVQYIIKLRVPVINQAIIGKLCGNFSQLSKNKYSSNVVEDLLKCSEENHAMLIVLEVMSSDSFLNVIQDPFGNYVVQTALSYSKGEMQLALSKRILDRTLYLHSHLYGKRVLEAAKRCSRRV